MKKVNKIPIILFFVTLAVLLAVSVTGLIAGKPAKAYDYYYNDPYSLFFEEYDVTFDVEKNRSIAVTEKITVHFTGQSSTGFIKDIPVNGGEQVKNLKVCELDGNVEKSVNYDVYFEDNDFISVDIGDYSNKTNKIYTYLLTYDYCLTKAQEGENLLFLNAVGLGRNYEIKSTNVTFILPDGYKSGSAEYIIGTYNSDYRYNDCPERTLDGKTILELKNIPLDKQEGITFELSFENGTLSTYSDAKAYLFLIPALILLGAVILLKLFVYNSNYLTPVVNYEAPDKMDPLMMGKLIDNNINSEDVTSLIFYWASKGYIKINLDDKNDPLLIRIMQTLPEPCRYYEALMYNRLFDKRDCVKISQLKNSFYTTVEAVKKEVNKQAKGLYDNKSMSISVVFAVLGGLLFGLAPLLLACLGISGKLLYLNGLIMLVPVFVVYFLSLTLKYYSLKFEKGKFILFYSGIVLLCVLFGIGYVILTPTCIIGMGAKITLAIASSLVVLCSVLLVSRTKEYTEKLNDILGFKNFITLAEKPQLEMLLEDDPQFYYNILPYAQVLGVTDKWEDKFKDITVAPPQWLTGNFVTTYFEFRIINGMLRTSMAAMTAGMVSRPSSSGVSGGGRGGFGGGHVGGGHGGGGFRGR